MKYFKDEVPEISDFTTNFQEMGLNGNKLNSELADFIKHINYVIEIETQKKLESNIIYDINYPFFSSDLLVLYLDKNNILEDKRKYEKFAEKAKSKNKKEKLESYQKILQKLNAKLEINKEMIKRTKDINTNMVNDVYLTFRIQKYNDIIIKAYSRGKCSRCCMIFCCQKRKIQHL